MVKALLVDPASAKKKGSDYTAAFVVGFSSDNNLYVLDMVRDRLNLSQRTDLLLSLHREWKPYKIGYEKYGKDGDIEAIRAEMERREYRWFEVTEVGGSQPKEDRIKRLVPLFEQGRVYLPERLIRLDYEKKRYDAVESFVEDEYLAFPVSQHDDMLDALARIFDLFPENSMPWPDRMNHMRQTQAVSNYNPFAIPSAEEHRSPSNNAPRPQIPDSRDWSDPMTWAEQGSGHRRHDTGGDYDPWSVR